MQKRQEEGHVFDNLWEFPGGKIKSGESPTAAAQREVWEEVGIKIEKPVFFKLYQSSYGTKTYDLHVHIDSQTRDLPVSDKQKWFYFSPRQNSRSLEGKIPSVNHAILDDCLKESPWDLF